MFDIISSIDINKFFFQESVPGSNRNSLKDSVGGGNSNRSSLDVSSSSYNTLIIHNQDDSWPPRPTPIRLVMITWIPVAK